MRKINTSTPYDIKYWSHPNTKPAATCFWLVPDTNNADVTFADWPIDVTFADVDGIFGVGRRFLGILVDEDSEIRPFSR